MIKTVKRQMLLMGAATFIGLVSGVQSASATSTTTTTGGGATFNEIVLNMEDSISGIPGLISGISYMMGILLGVLGILKIKDHVEKPDQTPLQQGAIRLAAGGGLFALPIVYEAMRTTIGDDGALVTAPAVKAISLDVAP